LPFFIETTKIIKPKLLQDSKRRWMIETTKMPPISVTSPNTN